VVEAEASQPAASATQTPLPSLLLPGAAVAAAVTVPVPDKVGRYQAVFWAEPASPLPTDPASPRAAMRLEVGTETARPECLLSALLETIESTLIQAETLQRLPDDYHDVTAGWFADWKRRIKSKLLGNFKRAYVDVLSRRQSAFNRHVLTILQELMHCCATLEHAGRTVPPGGSEPAIAQERIAELEQRMVRLEALLREKEATIP
jgi:hypothetical protein